ncbi:cyclic-phosphate processing receiver domain-containing protein [Arenibaculum pallidiluteum]|uniref:cyclic-phosphate processing receiver domain-containing protein n=1 Tax=Arenibaculum pallidiluteum TaxID=2812559 RepID=UPI001A962304|nr:cyclic-phosphate processing receiver domain-containing protein [Arenibaculum pallidiluteum]
MKMFLDDERDPVGTGWVVVRSVAEAIAWVEMHGWPIYVSFDNDLGDGQAEGRRFADFLIERDLDHGDMPESFGFYVHSQNLVARQAIEGKLRAYLSIRMQR